MSCARTHSTSDGCSGQVVRSSEVGGGGDGGQVSASGRYAAPLAKRRAGGAETGSLAGRTSARAMGKVA